MVKYVETCDDCGHLMDTKQEDGKAFVAICGSCGAYHLKVKGLVVQEHGTRLELAKGDPFEDGSWLRLAQPT